MRFDLAEGFPLMTTKDMTKQVKQIIGELLWFLDGDTNIRTLVKQGINIWNKDAYRNYKTKTRETKPMSYKEFMDCIRNHPDDSLFVEQWGNLGNIYGKQWRSWDVWGYGYEKSIDQIKEVIQSIKHDPYSRRHIVNAWNVAEIDSMGLPPCHVLFQLYVTNDGRLSCLMYQRSADTLLGVPFNIASYALLTMMIADQVGLGYGEFIHTIGDGHIYNDHIAQIEEQVSREPKPLPKMYINKNVKDIFSYTLEDFKLEGYVSHGEIKGDMST
jgi:thymidylate synthase